MGNNCYRILAVRDPQQELFIGHELALSWSIHRKDLPRGFVEAEGLVFAYGKVHFASGVRIKRLPRPPCHCGRHAFPHRRTKECREWLDAQM